MKKTILSILTFIVIFNFIFINPIYATSVGDLTEKASDDSKGSYQSNFDQLSEGTATNTYENGESETVSIDNSGVSVMGTIIGYFSKMFNMFPMICHILFTIVLDSGGIISNHVSKDDTLSVFSIESIIFGKYLILDVNIFKGFSEVGDSTKNEVDFGIFSSFGDVLNNFYDTVKLWFVIIRDLALVLNLAMLLYVAIRLAIATVASDKAKYKEFLYNWLISIAIIFTIQYILVFLNTFSDILTDIARNLKNNFEASGTRSFESEIIDSMYSILNKNGGLRVALYSIIYWILLWVELKFLFMYMKRMLKMMFLIIISPIITLTYPADKIGDGKAQAFTAWLKEYTTNLLVQPLHCFIYLVFMFMANNIALKAPLIGVVFLLSLTRSEKIVKTIIGVSGIADVGEQFSMKGFKGKLQGMIPKMGPKPGMPRG